MGNKPSFSDALSGKKLTSEEVDQVYEPATAIRDIYCLRSIYRAFDLSDSSVRGSSRRYSLIAEKPTALELLTFRIETLQKKMHCPCQKLDRRSWSDEAAS